MLDEPANANCKVAGVQLGVDTVANVERDIQARGGAPSAGGGGLAKCRVSALSGDYADVGPDVMAVNYDFDASGPAGRLVAVTIVNHANTGPGYENLLATRKAAATGLAGPLQHKSATELVASGPGCQLRLLPNADTWFIHGVSVSEPTGARNPADVPGLCCYPPVSSGKLARDSHHQPTTEDLMTALVTRRAAQALLVLALLMCTAACETTGGASDEGEPVLVKEESAPQTAPETSMELNGEEGEVPLVVARSGRPEEVSPDKELEEVIVKARAGDRHEVIRDFVSEAESILRDVELDYVFTGKGKKAALRGRPVVFALWSETKKEWSIVHIEIPRPPVKWKPKGKPLPFIVRTPGVEARHVKGTGAERLMFAFSRDGEQMKVYGRKFPVFDSALVAKKKWRAVVETAQPIVYLPFNEDTLDPLFVSGGTQFLLSTARKAIEELRVAKAPSVAFPGELLADVVPAEVLSTLAVIEQTDDADFVQKKAAAFNEVLSQYGLKREEAYRYSVSRAAALGPMQFTNKNGKGTYAIVVRRCPEASLDPNFERGATDLLNAMKAAICLFDIELFQMSSDIRVAYRDNMEVLGIFPVAAYNGGPRNVAKLYGVMKKMGVNLEDLRPPGEQPQREPVICPCLWIEDATGIRPVAIPKYNRENRWYIEKYQSILSVFE